MSYIIGYPESFVYYATLDAAIQAARMQVARAGVQVAVYELKIAGFVDPPQKPAPAETIIIEDDVLDRKMA
jgi:hypothetical protein